MEVSLDEMIKQNRKAAELTRDNLLNYKASQSTRDVTDAEEALKVMRQLNPNCNDDNLLIKMLQAHINGQQLSVSPEDLKAAGGVQMMVPVGAPPEEEEAQGFVINHSFSIKMPRAAEAVRNCTSVRLLDSPEVLAVHDLFLAEEVENIRNFASELTFAPAKSCIMKLRIENSEELQQFVVPDDLGELSISAVCKEYEARNCEVAVLESGSPMFEAIRARAAAVCRTSPSNIKTIVIEKYAEGQATTCGHFSHQRQGAVLMPLNTENEGGLTFNKVGIQLVPLSGMGVYIPSVYPEAPIPDLRTDFTIEAATSATLFYVVAYVELDSSRLLIEKQ